MKVKSFDTKDTKDTKENQDKLLNRQVIIHHSAFIIPAKRQDIPHPSDGAARSPKATKHPSECKYLTTSECNAWHFCSLKGV
jgi:hypothetical protein